MGRRKNVRLIVIPGLGVFPAGNRKKGVVEINKAFTKQILNGVGETSKRYEIKFKSGGCIISCYKNNNPK